MKSTVLAEQSMSDVSLRSVSWIIIAVVVAVLIFAGTFILKKGSAADSFLKKGTSEVVGEKGRVTFNDLLDPLLADGFDFPVGDVDGQGSYKSKLNGKTYNGWYVATKFGESYSLGIHPGEDWNGIGGGDTDTGQPVWATAKGKVVDSKDYGSPWEALW